MLKEIKLFHLHTKQKEPELQTTLKNVYKQNFYLLSLQQRAKVYMKTYVFISATYNR